MSREQVEEVIVKFAVSDKASTGAYNDLISFAINNKIAGKENFGFALLPGEESYMEHYCPSLHTKSGKWKFRTGLPGAYTSAKSVIGKALQEGRSLVDGEGKPLGKTALGRAEKKYKSYYEEAQHCLEKIWKVWPRLTQEEKENIITSVEAVAELK